jgi:hypothetical protein
MRNRVARVATCSLLPLPYEGFSGSKTTAAATNRTPWTPGRFGSMIG